MAWLQANIDTTAVAAESLADALIALGALSAAIEDALAGTILEEPIFEETGEPADRIWRQSRILALFSESTDIPSLIMAASDMCCLPPPSFTVEHVPEQDWVRMTQEQFQPIRISDQLWITPTWHELLIPDILNLRLDPGLAFGTGSHPTTRLCLEWLDTHIQGNESVLDYGCGSGILAIAALKLGVTSAIGVDIDVQAIYASRCNAKQNNVPATFYLPDEIPAGTYDILLANVLANPLRMLAGLLSSYVKTGGKIVLSGILAEQAEELSSIYSAWFSMEPAVFDEDWTRLTGTRR